MYPGVRRDCEADVIERLKHRRMTMMGTFLIADDDDDGHPCRRRHPAIVVGLGKESIHPLDHSVGNTRRLANLCANSVAASQIVNKSSLSLNPVVGKRA